MNRRKAIGSLAALPLIGKIRGENDIPVKWKIMVTGAHPDDPETGCGGAIAKWTKAGHEVVVVYLTHGEAGVEDTEAKEAAAIRTKEATAACKLLNARPFFLSQIDGSTEINNDWFDKALAVLQQESPDVLLTHWLIDTHRDHRVCANLFYDAWLTNGQASALYFYEVMTGGQTQNFNPTDYVDITEEIEIKHQACFAHKSQFLEDSYENHHGQMELYRGMEATVSYAEAYLRHWQSVTSPIFSV
jgi:LmbE family N-acetylglucosaminyl deacetylase